MSDPVRDVNLEASEEPRHDEPEGYDEWFRREVEIGLREADDPNTEFYSLEESDLRAAKLLDMLQQSQYEKAG